MNKMVAPREFLEEEQDWQPQAQHVSANYARTIICHLLKPVQSVFFMA